MRERRGELTEATVVRRNPSIAGRELREGDGAVLLNPETGAYHRLNPTGAFIWRLLEEPLPLGELERRLRLGLEAAAEMPSSDLASYVADLAGRDLVRLEPAPSA